MLFLLIKEGFFLKRIFLLLLQIKKKERTWNEFFSAQISTLLENKAVRMSFISCLVLRIGYFGLKTTFPEKSPAESVRKLAEFAMKNLKDAYKINIKKTLSSLNWLHKNTEKTQNTLHKTYETTLNNLGICNNDLRKKYQDIMYLKDEHNKAMNFCNSNLQALNQQNQYNENSIKTLYEIIVRNEAVADKVKDLASYLSSTSTPMYLERKLGK